MTASVPGQSQKCYFRRWGASPASRPPFAKRQSAMTRTEDLARGLRAKRVLLACNDRHHPSCKRWELAYWQCSHYIRSASWSSRQELGVSKDPARYVQQCKPRRGLARQQQHHLARSNCRNHINARSCCAHDPPRSSALGSSRVSLKFSRCCLLFSISRAMFPATSPQFQPDTAFSPLPSLSLQAAMWPAEQHTDRRIHWRTLATELARLCEGRARALREREGGLEKVNHGRSYCPVPDQPDP